MLDSSETNVLLLVIGSVVAPLVAGLLWLLKRTIRRCDRQSALILKLQQESDRQLSDDTIGTLDETGHE